MNRVSMRNALVFCFVLATAQATAADPGKDAARPMRPMSQSATGNTVVRRPPITLPAPALLVSGALAVETQGGAQAQVSVIVSDTNGAGFLDVRIDGGTLAGAPLVEPLGAGQYRVTLRTSDRLPTGTYRGQVRFRMCMESPCIHPIAGASALRPYRWSVLWASPGPWETFQRDAGHSGFVPVAIRPSAITPLWTRDWTEPNDVTGINAVVSEGGRVFVTDDDTLYGVDATTGALLWQQDFSNFWALNPPAVSNGRVYVATTGQELTFLWSFDAADGMPRSQSTFQDQWSNLLAPTISNGIAYTNGGYYGGGVYAFDADDGMALWVEYNGDDDMTTPAVAGDRLYYYDGTALNVRDAVDGTLLRSIADPYNPETGYSYHGAPMLGSADHVTTFSGDAFSGMASSNVEQFDARPLVNFSPAAGTVRWRTAKAYKTQPAVAGGVVYAGANNPKSFDAISEATGQILWSWVPGTADTEFHRNVVVTKNLAFVSTNRAVYAIDLATHLPVWSSPTPGDVAISEEGILLIAEATRLSTGRLLAFKLHSGKLH